MGGVGTIEKEIERILGEFLFALAKAAHLDETIKDLMSKANGVFDPLVADLEKALKIPNDIPGLSALQREMNQLSSMDWPEVPDFQLQLPDLDPERELTKCLVMLMEQNP